MKKYISYILIFLMAICGGQTNCFFNKVAQRVSGPVKALALKFPKQLVKTTLKNVALAGAGVASAVTVGVVAWPRKKEKKAIVLPKIAHSNPHNTQLENLYTQLVQGPHAKITQKYLAEFAQEDKNFLQEWADLAGLPVPAIIALRNEYKKRYELEIVSQKKVSKKRQVNNLIVRSMAKKLGIDLNSFEIVLTDPHSDNGTYSSNYVSVDHSLYIGGLRTTSLKAAIVPQLMQILCDDAYELSFLSNKLLEARTVDKEKLNSLQQRYVDYKKLKADVLACLKEPDLIKSIISNYNKRVDDATSKNNLAHAAEYIKRKSYVEQLDREISDILPTKHLPYIE